MPGTHVASRTVAAAALSVLAYRYLHLAPAYDTAGAVVSHGILLRGLAAAALVAAVAVLQFDHLVAYVIGLCAACVALAVSAAGGWVAGAAAVVAVAGTCFLAVSEVVRLLACLRLRADLGAYVLDRLAPGEREVVDAHVLVCARCREETAGLAPVAAYLGRADRDLVVGFLTGAPQSASRDVPNKQ